MTTSHLTKPQTGTEPKGKPIKASAWRNLIFGKNGKSYLGLRTHPSEDIARKAFAICMADDAPAVGCIDGPIYGPIIYGGSGMSSGILKVDISHAIQIPARAP